MLYSSGYFNIENFYGLYSLTSYRILKELFINPNDHQEPFYDWMVHAVLRERYGIITFYSPNVDTDLGKCLLDEYRWPLANDIQKAFTNFNFMPMAGYAYKIQVLGPDLIISKGAIRG